MYNMFSLIKIIAIAAIWFKKTTSLPKLYHGISNKRDIPVSTLKAFEKQGRKLIKLGLDVKYFKSCLDLKLSSGVLEILSSKFKCLPRWKRFVSSGCKEKT